VLKPTRGNDILNIVLCNEPMSQLLFVIPVISPFSVTNDHCQVEFVIFTESLVDETKLHCKHYDWKTGKLQTRVGHLV